MPNGFPDAQYPISIVQCLFGDLLPVADDSQQVIHPSIPDGGARRGRGRGEDAGGRVGRFVEEALDVGGQKLRDKWFDGPSTYLGAFIHGFPNLAMVAGPQGASASVNFPRSIEAAVNFVTDFLVYAREHGHQRFEATAEAEERWTDHVRKMYGSMLMRKAKSWFTGYNSNVEGHEEGKVRYFVYNGGTPKFVATINKVAEGGYEGLDFGTSGKPPGQRASVATAA